MEVTNLFIHFNWVFKTRNQLYLKNELSYEDNFLLVVRHPWKLKIYSFISSGCSKQGISYLKNELSYEVYFLHVIRHTYLIQSIHMGVVRLTW